MSSVGNGLFSGWGFTGTYDQTSLTVKTVIGANTYTAILSKDNMLLFDIVNKPMNEFLTSFLVFIIK